MFSGRSKGERNSRGKREYETQPIFGGETVIHQVHFRTIDKGLVERLLSERVTTSTPIPDEIKQIVGDKHGNFSLDAGISSEFYGPDGEIHLENNWDKTNPNWKGTNLFKFDEENVKVESDMQGRKALVLKVNEVQPRKAYTTSFLRSKKAFTHGYVEILCKLGTSQCSSSFWLKEVWSPKDKVPTWSNMEREIDVFEYTNDLFGTFRSNLHHRQPWKTGRPYGPPQRVSVDFQMDLSKERFLRVGILVMPDCIQWFLNGNCIRETKQSGIDSANGEQETKTFSPPMLHVQFDREMIVGWDIPESDHFSKIKIRRGFQVDIGKEGLRDYRIYYCRAWLYNGP